MTSLLYLISQIESIDSVKCPDSFPTLLEVQKRSDILTIVGEVLVEKRNHLLYSL